MIETIHTQGVVNIDYATSRWYPPLKDGDKVHWNGRILEKDNKIHFIITIGDYIIYEWDAGEPPKFSNTYEESHCFSGITESFIDAYITKDLLVKLLANT